MEDTKKLSYYPLFIVRRAQAFDMTPAEYLMEYKLSRKDLKKPFSWRLWRMAWSALRKEFSRNSYPVAWHNVCDFSARDLAYSSYLMRGSK